MNARIALFVSLALLLGALSLAAQEDTYVVQKGDNLWMLAGSHLDSPLLWEHIYKDNSFLQEARRRFQKDGTVYVIVRPGEKLVGLEKAGIMATLTPIDKLKLPQPDPVKVPVTVPTTPAWVWWPLALAVLLLIAAWLIYRMLTRDPVNSRPAMVPGGVTDVTAPTAIQQVAARTAGYTQATSVASSVYQQFIIVRQTAGRIWGNMTVRYADGRSIPRRLDGNRAYQAEVSFPDGHEETLYMLQGCGNDLRYGGISRYLPGPEFRFEADSVAPMPIETPAQTAAPTQEPAQPETPDQAEVPAADATPPIQSEPATSTNGNSAQTETVPEGLVKFELRKATNGQGAMARFTGVDEGDDLTFETTPGVVTIRFRPKS